VLAQLANLRRELGELTPRAQHEDDADRDRDEQDHFTEHRQTLVERRRESMATRLAGIQHAYGGLIDLVEFTRRAAHAESTYLVGRLLLQRLSAPRTRAARRSR
jgi:hypothetical protein